MRAWHIPSGPAYGGGEGWHLALIKGEGRRVFRCLHNLLGSRVRSGGGARKKRKVFSGKRTREGAMTEVLL